MNIQQMAHLKTKIIHINSVICLLCGRHCHGEMAGKVTSPGKPLMSGVNHGS